MIQTVLHATLLATQGHLDLPNQSLRRRLPNIKCLEADTTCMKDATCAAIANQDQRATFLQDCAQNKLCSEMQQCRHPCWPKIVPCLGVPGSACAAVYPSGESEPTPAEIQACAQEPLCKAILVCENVPIPAPTPKWDGWTLWYDRDDPTGSADAEGIEFEANHPCNRAPLELIGTGSHGKAIESGPSPTPLAARCVRVSDGMDSTKTGQVFSRPCGVKGLICLNADNQQDGCDDYKVQYLCPMADTSKYTEKCRKCAEEYAARGFCECKCDAVGDKRLCACGDRRRLVLEPSFKHCDSCEENVEEYCKTYGPPPKRTCYSIGDPHVKQFDDTTFDSHSVGWTRLYKSGSLDIQVAQAKWGKATDAAINRAVRYSTDGGTTWDETIENGKLLGSSGDSNYRYFAALPYETYLRVEKADYRASGSVTEKFIYNVYITTNTYLSVNASGQCVDGIPMPIETTSPRPPQPSRRLLEGSGGVPFPTGNAVKVSEEQAKKACAGLNEQKKNCITDIRMANDPGMTHLIKRDFDQVEKTVNTLKTMGAATTTTTTAASTPVPTPHNVSTTSTAMLVIDDFDGSVPTQVYLLSALAPLALLVL